MKCAPNESVFLCHNRVIGEIILRLGRSTGPPICGYQSAAIFGGCSRLLNRKISAACVSVRHDKDPLFSSAV